MRIPLAFFPIVFLCLSVVCPAQAITPGAHSVAFSPDGKLLAAGTGGPRTPGVAIIWDIATGKPLWIHRAPKGIPAIAFAPDGRTVAIGSFGPDAQLLDVATGKVRITLSGNGKAARSVAFSPDGKLLAVGSNDRSIRLWDLATATVRQSLQGHSDVVFSVSFSPNGRSLLSAGGDSARLWDVSTGREQRMWKHGPFQVCCAIFADDRWVLSCGADGTYRAWDLNGERAGLRFQSYGGANWLAFDPNNHTVAVAEFRAMHLHALDLRAPTESDQQRIQGLMVQLDNDDYAVREQAGKQLLKIGLHSEPALGRALKESPSVEVRIRCRRLRAAVLSDPGIALGGHTDSVECVAFSPSGKLLASASRDGTVRVWDVPAGKEVARFLPSEEASPPR